MRTADADALAGAVAAWVETHSDIRALAVAGSWSRGTARQDSDLDLIVLANRPDRYRSDQHWLYRLALPKPFRVISHDIAEYGVVWSCHAAIASAGELELTFGGIDWACIDPLDPGTRSVVKDGFRVLVDKDGDLHRLVEAVRKSS